MQTSELHNIQRTLKLALGVRYHVSGLLRLAHEITLVSMNAKITSAQIGEAGKVFMVMTNEITEISNSLRETVGDIKKLTHEWTRVIAIATEQMRHCQSIEEAERLLKKEGREILQFVDAKASSQRILNEYEDSYPRLLEQLWRIIEGMERSLKLVNYVKIGILIESERLTGMDGSESPFAHLAQEMQVAADEIRTIAQETMQELTALRKAS